jgi:hypothetical protein
VTTHRADHAIDGLSDPRSSLRFLDRVHCGPPKRL